MYAVATNLLNVCCSHKFVRVALNQFLMFIWRLLYICLMLVCILFASWSYGVSYLFIYLFFSHLSVISTVMHCVCVVYYRGTTLGFERRMRVCRTKTNKPTVAVPWLRRLAAALPARKSGFDPGSVHMGYFVDKLAWGQVFSRVLRFLFHSAGAPLLGKGRTIIVIFIFITGLHNKPQGCGAPVASAAGPFTTKETNQR
jgi:hypothetical protein